MPPWQTRGLTGGLTFPDATNTGPAAGTDPYPLSLGTSYTAGAGGMGTANTGWSVSSSGTWSFDGPPVVISALSIPYNLNLQGTSSEDPLTGVTVENCVITPAGGDPNFGISCRHTSGALILNCTISGNNAGNGRVSYAISSIDGDDAGLTVQACNVFWHRIGINTPTSVAYTVRDCYFHDQGFIGGDHSETTTCGNGTGPGLFYHNTMLNSLDQTTCLNIGNTAGSCSSFTAENNLLAGGVYCVYGAGQSSSFGNGTAITIQNNYFSTMFFSPENGYSPGGGQFGPLAYWAGDGSGNSWAGNVWLDGPDAGQIIPSS